MKLFTILIFALSIQLSAKSNAQDVTLKASHITLKKAFRQIEKQTGYSFFVNHQLLKEATPVSLSLKKATIDEALQACLRNQPLTYSIIDKTVILKAGEIVSVTPPIKLLPQHEVTGRVVDSTTGEPLVGVSIKVKGSGTGTVTDAEGKFSLEVESQAVLEVSYLGYASKEISAAGKKSITISLTTSATGLNQLVVVGYGTQKKKDLTGAVASISAEKLNTESNANVVQALQGKIPGVRIVSQGGAPGAGSRIMIRGIGTLNNSNPLYVVDGIYMDNIDNINPEDIANISVLKDASAAAIYGSRAANGVVLITTKTGSNTLGEPIWEVSANIGVQMPSKYLDMLDAQEWAKVTTISRKAINEPPLEMANNLNVKPDNNWQRIMMKPAMMQNYHASVKGGGESFTYYTGLSYFDQDGIVKGTNYKRFNIQLKSKYQKGRFTIGDNIILSRTHDLPLPIYSRGGLLGMVLQAIPTLEKYDTSLVGGYGGVYGSVTDIPNPLGFMDRSLYDRAHTQTKIFANLYAQFEIFDGLKYKLNFTPDFAFDRSFSYQNKYDFGLTTNSITQLSDERQNNKDLLIENLLSYDNNFGDNKISALIGYSYQSFGYRYLIAEGQGMPEGLKEVDAATEGRTNGGSSTRSTLTSIIARIFYSYKNKYLITATFRRDGSSKFSQKNRYGNFPSVSVGWDMTKENFLQSISWLNQLKLRGGYGILGNQEISDYMYTSTVTTGINYPNGEGGLLHGAFPKDFASPNIKWEQTEMTNIGIDLTAIDYKLSFTANYYIKNTKGILLSVPIPISTGGANDPIRNAGKIRNKGIELNIGWRDNINKDFSYNLNIIGSFVKNKVVKMGTGSQVIWGGTSRFGVNTTKTLAGYPIGSFWLVATDGYFQNQSEIDAYSKNGELIQPNAAPGDIRFKDVNNDGKINDEDRIYSGSPFADFTTAINGSISYKNWSLSIGLQGIIGNKIYNATRQVLEGVNKGTNFLKTTLDYWSPQNRHAAHPRLIWDDPNRNVRPESNRYLEDGSFFRIRNIKLSYNLPALLFNNAIKNAKVYINLENPLTITGYSGYTPDINSGGATSRGFDSFTYPTNKIFMIGLNVTF